MNDVKELINLINIIYKNIILILFLTLVAGMLVFLLFRRK